MNLELQQLDLRYEKLRTRKPETERKLVASLAEIGQQVPVVVVRGEAPERFLGPERLVIEISEHGDGRVATVSGAGRWEDLIDHVRF